MPGQAGLGGCREFVGPDGFSRGPIVGQNGLTESQQTGEDGSDRQCVFHDGPGRVLAIFFPSGEKGYE